MQWKIHKILKQHKLNKKLTNKFNLKVKIFHRKSVDKGGRQNRKLYPLPFNQNYSNGNQILLMDLKIMINQ